MAVCNDRSNGRTSGTGWRWQKIRAGIPAAARRVSKAIQAFQFAACSWRRLQADNFSTFSVTLSSILKNEGQVRGRISIPQTFGFSTLGVNVMFNLPSVTSTFTLST